MTVSDRNTVLLVTSTIMPPATMPHLQLFDAAERRHQYEEALRFHLRAAPEHIRTILYCDNSGAALDSLEAIAAAENPHGIETRFLSYASPVDPGLGKGRCELELIDRGMERFAASIREGDRIWKITGRLKLVNIAEMLASQPERFTIYADFRKVPLIGNRLGRNHALDTRTIAFSPEGYRRYLQDSWHVAWMSTEAFLFDRLHPALASDPMIVPRLRRQPVLAGVNGASMADYASAGYRARNALRRVTRRFLPGLWL